MSGQVLPFKQAPGSICLLRLSALGDIMHTLPVFNAIRKQWPSTQITWIIGKAEYELVKHIDHVEFLVFNKKEGFKAYRKMYAMLKQRRFDVLLHMQMSLRASVLSLMVKAPIKLGFDKQRAKDAQWLFTNHKIQYQPGQHVIESLFGFAEALGIKDYQYEWNIKLPGADIDAARKLLGDRNNFFIISPCSSQAYRNWTVDGYAAVADYLATKYKINVVLTGGNSKIEKDMTRAILQRCENKPLNLVGKSKLPVLLAIIEKARCMISPDSGPAHFATAMGTPVIGLYATTNPDRARPYQSKEWVVNRYPDAIHKKFNTTVEQVNWGQRVRDEWAMKLITIEEVKKMIDQFLSSVQK